MTTIRPEILKLDTIEGFLDQFYLFCVEYDTPDEAYEATERMYNRHYGRNKYSSYHSFKNNRNEFYRKKSSDKVTGKVISVTCLECGKEFTAQRKTARFCSAACRVKYNRKRT